ncbi:MAG: ATP-binding protein [Oscillospiraceae bacterium]|nr:ATP-binding protein [Oscillospiraceae bacterium]
MGYSKQAYEKAWALMDERLQHSRAQTDARRQEILRNIPEIERIELEMAGLAASSIHAAATGGADVAGRIQELGRENIRLQELRASFLREAGYPADALSEQFFCPKCRDRGYIGQEMCACFRELLRTQAYAVISDYPDAPHCKNCTFEGFNLSYYTDAARGRMSEILDYCRHYADTFSGQSPSLLMVGRTGLGKTHLSLAIAGTVVGRGFGVVYTPVQRLCDRLENSKFSYQDERKDRYEQELKSVLECDLLVLDDLGTEFISTFSAAAVSNIINSRLLDARPTVVSTNLELSALERQYSQRIASRLSFSYKALMFMGEDIRFLMRTRR